MTGERHIRFFFLLGCCLFLARAPLVRAQDAPAPMAPPKSHTGWILDQHVYDPTAAAAYPTLPSDVAQNDEGAGATAAGKDGRVWQVHSTYWSDTVSVPDHPSTSYCLALYSSPDGGVTWRLYRLVYDTEGRDLLNPALAVDTTAAADRIFVAYERANSVSDHDVYVFSVTSTFFPGAVADPQTAAIATSTLMEENPSIASDFLSGGTSYRVVAYDRQMEDNASNYDVFASQSSGAGAQADWSVPVNVTGSAQAERYPSLAAGASGYPTAMGYLHLAYDHTSPESDQLLVNPGFESGQRVGWVADPTGGINLFPSQAHTGDWVLWLGGGPSEDYCYQQVTIPADAWSAQFSFWLKMTWPYGTLKDRYYVEVTDTSDTILQTLFTCTNLDGPTAWTQYTFDLMAYKGQTVRIRFENWNQKSTNFWTDDTALVVSAPVAHTVRYARAAHPGTDAYPKALQVAQKLTVLANRGIAQPYGPPSVIATHGGSATMGPARVVVAAEQTFPANVPNPGDAARYQLAYAWNTCNGGTNCGSITCPGGDLSLNWRETYTYDGAADERSPSLAADGGGLATSGVSLHPNVYMAYYHRDQVSGSPGGELRILATDAADETCTGFVSGSWSNYGAQAAADDGDGLAVVSRPRTIGAFVRGDGFPGASFNKLINHTRGPLNEDVYFTTAGDNYEFDTLSGGSHIDAGVTFGGGHSACPVTYPLPAGLTWPVTADAPWVTTGGHTYTFSSWSTGATTFTLNLLGEFCRNGVPCTFPNSIAANYDEETGCPGSLPPVTGVMGDKLGTDAHFIWDTPAVPPARYLVYRAEDCTAAGNFTGIGTSISASFLDTSASGPLFFYIIVSECGGSTGPWGHYGQ